jgi:hydroxymethylbilane synthase
MKLTIATRGSALALWQANHIKSLLENEHPGLEVSLNVIKTTGDKILDVPLAKIGGKGLFVKEIETALLEGQADLAVHSMKDVPTDLPEELELYVNPIKELSNDAFLSVKYGSLKELKAGAVVGTSSLRRKLQLLEFCPGLDIRELRGNVDTRIRKMVDGEYDAIILAAAGLKRLGLTEHVKEIIAEDILLPAVCQGVLGIETRRDDDKTKGMIAFLKDKNTETVVAAERAFLKKLEGGCQAPIACHGVLEGAEVHLSGYLSDLEGKRIIRQELSGAANEAAALGVKLAENMLAAGGAEILKEIYT